MQVFSTARRLIRLREHGGNLMAVSDEPFERRYGELGCAHEDQLHAVLITQRVRKVTSSRLCGTLRLGAKCSNRIEDSVSRKVAKSRKAAKGALTVTFACTVTDTYNPNLICNRPSSQNVGHCLPQCRP